MSRIVRCDLIQASDAAPTARSLQEIKKAMIALLAGAGTALVGLIVPSVRVLYDYSWFVGFAVSFVAYYALTNVYRHGFERDTA